MKLIVYYLKKKMTKINFIPQKRIEKKADEVLKNAFDQNVYDYKTATPIDLICEKVCNLKLLYQDLSQFNSDALGCFDFSSNTIFINDQMIDVDIIDDGRENFTKAHEIGHFVLHREIYDKNPDMMAMLHDDSDDFMGQKAKSDVEYQANYFAACLLMPKELLLEKWNNLDCPSPQEKREQLKDFFKVSREAMQRRLSDLELI